MADFKTVQSVSAELPVPAGYVLPALPADNVLLDASAIARRG